MPLTPFDQVKVPKPFRVHRSRNPQVFNMPVLDDWVFDSAYLTEEQAKARERALRDAGYLAKSGRWPVTTPWLVD